MQCYNILYRFSLMRQPFFTASCKGAIKLLKINSIKQLTTAINCFILFINERTLSYLFINNVYAQTHIDEICR